MSTGIVLSALDGSNPLAFLAAIGTLRLLHLEVGGEVKMRWVREGVWKPEIFGFSGSEQDFCEQILAAASKRLPLVEISRLGKNITVPKGTYVEFIAAARERLQDGERLIADFVTAFGCEILETGARNNRKVQVTKLCHLRGSGQQDFVRTVQALTKLVTIDLVREALFGPWKKRKRWSMRWDPDDAVEYAYQFNEPSDEGSSSIYGANLLAVHALPLVPTQPTQSGLGTTGFRSSGRLFEYSWPMWSDPAGLDTTRSLLSLKELQAIEQSINGASLKAFGIQEVYRVPQIKIGKEPLSKFSFRPAKSI